MASYIFIKPRNQLSPSEVNMLSEQVPKITAYEFSRCEEQSQTTGYGKSPSPNQKMDSALKDTIYQTLWKDTVIRMLDYEEINIYVKNRVVYLNGHIVSTTSKSRIENALRTIPNILEIKNNLVLDDKLTLEVATSLAGLEHDHACKFFTGASHGVISLNGTVSSEHVKLLAEKCASSNPNVRGVINNVRVSMAGLIVQTQPFLQPMIGVTINFLDGVSAIVKQVIMNPNNRRVIAMIISGKFSDQIQELKPFNNDEAHHAQKLFVLKMSAIRHLTKSSGFLNIESNDRKRYKEFNPNDFIVPNKNWVPPYPYCPDDVLFCVEQQDVENQIVEQPTQSSLLTADRLLREELITNDIE